MTGSPLTIAPSEVKDEARIPPGSPPAGSSGRARWKRAAAAKGSENYLKRLREGYGYTLRRVEERSSAIGEPIDNSQLSRFEKGKAYPSFDKLRVSGAHLQRVGPELLDIIDLEKFDGTGPRTPRSRADTRRMGGDRSR
jgi:hypothetical protein